MDASGAGRSARATSKGQRVDSQTDNIRTTVVEGTSETAAAQAEAIQARGGRIISVRVVTPAGPDGAPAAIEIAYTEGD
jgi:hypothetical protein